MIILVLLQLISSTPKTIHQIEYFSHHDDAPKQLVPLERPVLPLQERKMPMQRTVYGFLPYWQRSQYTTIRWDLITHIVPFGIEINGNGFIVNSHGWPGYWRGVIDSAHAHGVIVNLAVILFDADQIHTLITSPTNTANAINTLLNAVNAGGVEGVNIDFEIPYSADRDHLTAFMRALSDTFHNHNLQVYMDVMAVDDAWSDRYDEAALGSFLDGLMVMSYDYFWPGSENAGPPSPLSGYSYNFTWSLNHYITTTGRPEKVVMGVPYYGYDWPTYDSTRGSRTRGRASAVFYATAATNARIYGRIWDSYSQTPWYRYRDYTTWHQCWYDDDSSLTLKYQTVNSTAAQGIGIWALTYDGMRQELWYALLANFAEPWDAPGEITMFRVDPLFNGRVRLSWSAAENAAKYDVFVSTDGQNFIKATSTFSTIVSFGGLDTNSVYFYKVRPVNPWHEGHFSTTLAIRPSGRNIPQVMVVNSTDDSLAILPYARMLLERNLFFSSVTASVVEDSQVTLPWYDAVVWISGDTGDSAAPAITPAVEPLLQNYVNSGGHLLISGSNIAQSLASTGNPADTAFLSNALGATFVSGDVPHNYTISGALPQFSGTYNFDDGTHGHYDVADPDGIRAASDAVTAFLFDSVDSAAYGVAGVAKGSNVLFITVPLETVYPTDSAVSLMHKAFDMFGITSIEENAGAQPSRGHLLSVTSLAKNGTIQLVPLKGDKPVRFQIMDIYGRTIYSGELRNTRKELRLPSNGVFFVRATDGIISETVKVINVR